MVNQEIVKWLVEAKRRGFSTPLLRKKLLESGFPEKDVDDAIAMIEKPSMPQQNIPKKIDLFDKSYQSTPTLGQGTQERKPFSYPTQSAFGQKAPAEQNIETALHRGGGRWMKIAGIMGIILLVINLTLVATYFVSKSTLSAFSLSAL